MNQKRSRRRKETSLDWDRNTVVQPNDEAKSLRSSAEQVNVRASNTTQSNPLDRFLRYYWQDSRWSNFNRGLFWGGLVSLTAIFSALGGMALTRIDAVEQRISARIQKTSTDSSVPYSALTSSLQILLVEVELDDDTLTDFSKATVGKSKTILLLEVEPESNSTRAIFIPLDSSTYIPGVGQGTIGNAYQIGGIELLSEAVNQLPYDIAVDRYLRTTPQVFQQLIDSGKINFDSCDSRLMDCSNKLDRVVRQETAFKTIRQRLNIPSYLASLATAVTQVESQLDTNLDSEEIMSVANFIKELEPDRVKVDLLPGYTSGIPIKKGDRISSIIDLPKSDVENSQGTSLRDPFKQNSVAVQNTTDDPELGRRVVAHLRKQNFADVYLVKHIPLKLQKTKIVSNYTQVETANSLKSTLGFGNLEPESAQQQIILQLGEDALSLTTDYRSY